MAYRPRSESRAAQSARTHRVRRVLAGVLAFVLSALTLASVGIVSSASPALAEAGFDASQFHGVVWSQPFSRNDNACDCDLLLDGLSTLDTYTTVQPKTDAILDSFRSSLGANTVRIPINYKTVTDPWWNTYRGIIDAATAKGFNVDLSYWTENASGAIPSMANFTTMWNVVVGAYKNNARVYFDPLNEPSGYSNADWLNIECYCRNALLRLAAQSGEWADIEERYATLAMEYPDHVLVRSDRALILGQLAAAYGQRSRALAFFEDAAVLGEQEPQVTLALRAAVGLARMRLEDSERRPRGQS